MHHHALTKNSGTILRPRITEKASIQSEKNNVYVFEVAKSANKHTVLTAFVEMYKVTPVRINIAKIAPKAVFSRGKAGVKSGGKKAYIYLKKGDTIEII